MGYFKYGKKEIQHLKERDPLLGEKIDQIGMVQRETNPNIISYKDLVIRREMMKLYNLESLSKKDFDIYKKRYEPYATVASIYLWKLSLNV